MREEWQEKPLHSVAYLAGRIGWKGLTAKEYTEEGPLFLSVHSLNYGDFVDFRDAFHISQERYDESPEIMLQPNDILICKDGAGIGKLGIVGELPGPATINSSLLLIRSYGEVLPKYLYHKLCSPFFQSIVQERIDGATTPHLYQREIKQFPIFVPPLAEQERIVALLDEAFEGIDRTIANTEMNLVNAGELFESHLNGIFSQKGKGWVERPLGDLINVDHGFAFRSEFFADDGEYVLLTPGNFYEEGGYRDRREKQKYYFGEIPDGYILSKGDILIAMTEQAPGLLGSPLIVPEDNKFLHNQRLGLVRVKPRVPWVNEFFFHAFNTKEFRSAVHFDASGVKVRHTSPKKLCRVKIRYPEDSVAQQRLAVLLDGLREQTDILANRLRRKLSLLAALKQSILQRAFASNLTKAKPVAHPLRSLTISPAHSQAELTARILAFAHDRHERTQREKTFGRVKAQKTLHLVESIGGIDLGRSPIKDAAGPNDFPHMLRAEKWAKKHQFFEFRQRSNGYIFRKLGRYDEHVRTTKSENLLQEKQLGDVVDLLIPMNTEDAEVFVTVHAAWNNLIIDEVRTTDQAIIHEARESWHPDKAKIPRERFEEAIRLIRAKGVVPDGSAKRVGGQETLL